MSVLAVGMSHRSSPVALLERVALDDETRMKAMTAMATSPAVNEVLMVSTCNRTEVYADVDRFHPGVSAVTELLATHANVALGDMSAHLYVHYEDRAAQHLFSVACGLDSMVVGEGQILGQVRGAIKDAQRAGTLGRALNDLGQRALRVGKRAHTETHLDHAGADMVSLGLSVAGQYLRPATSGSGEASGPLRHPDGVGCPAAASGDVAEDVAAALPQPRALTGLRVLVLGAGSMSALAANTVARQGASSVAVANRTYHRAERLAECLSEAYEPITSHAVPYEDASSAVADADLVISCTGAQGLVLSRAQVADALPAPRLRRGPVFLDLALPRDIDEGVRQLPGVHLVDIESMRRAADEGADDSGSPERAGAISVVRGIVEEEVTEYQSVRRAELVAPTVVALRAKAKSVVDAELDRLHGRLPDLDDRAREEVTRTMRRIVDKLLHQPTVRVKELAAGPDGDSYEAALRELFDLDPAAPDVVTRLDPAPTRGEEDRQ